MFEHFTLETMYTEKDTCLGRLGSDLIIDI